MTAQKRKAFTLLELVTVLALLLILLGLLLPAVQKVRQAASRSQSSNNLKQLGLGAHNYASAYNVFPAGRDEKGYSVHAVILPYLEQEQVFKLIDFKKDPTDKAHAEVRATRIQIFLSPMDPITTVSNDLGANNYFFNAGTKSALKDNDGLFFLTTKMRFADITDGTSNTIMTGESLKGDGAEKATDLRRQHVAYTAKDKIALNENAGVDDFKNNKKIVANRGSTWLQGDLLQTLFNAQRPLQSDKPDVVIEDIEGMTSLRSLNNVLLVGFADGSVRTLTTNLKHDMWQGLCTRAGGEIVNVD